MANLNEIDVIKASQLPEATTVTENQFVVISDGTVSKKIRLDKLKGETGSQGANGINGVDGTTPTIIMGTITTLEPGEQATAELIPRENNEYTLNLGIPKGQNGTSSNILTSSNGTKYKLIVDDSGNLSTEVVLEQIITE